MKIRKALLSLSDKRGLLPLAQLLADFGCQLISTGGTAVVLREAGLTVTDISAVSGNPEAFGGRMKTLSFAVESAILFHRQLHAEEAAGLGIEPIDMVVCNLYPFQQAAQAGAPLPELIEQIDIGGPTMLRAAAKNAEFVAAVSDPGDYPALLQELRVSDGALCRETRLRLARKAFHHTADYDAVIASTLDERAGQLSLRLAFDQPQPLRYGENSHQRAWFLRQRGAERSLHDLQLLGGKALSHNNIIDIHAALESVCGLSGPGCAIVKHNNPCGLAQGDDQPAVFQAAWAGDPLSAFGSVIAFNRPLELETPRFLNLHAEKVRQRKFVEVVAAPGFAPGVAEYLGRNRNLRIVRFHPDQLAGERSLRHLPGALLLQERDTQDLDGLRWVTERRPAETDEELLRFGIQAVRQVRSNAIVVVRRMSCGSLQLLGIGAGQPNRVDATRLALARALANLELECQEANPGAAAHVSEQLGAAYLVSDAFFPFPDNVEEAATAGIRHLFQPGGSMRDKGVIRRCDALGLAMAFTGLRHFKH